MYLCDPLRFVCTGDEEIMRERVKNHKMLVYDLHNVAGCKHYFQFNIQTARKKIGIKRNVLKFSIVDENKIKTV